MLFQILNNLLISIISLLNQHFDLDTLVQQLRDLESYIDPVLSIIGQGIHFVSYFLGPTAFLASVLVLFTELTFQSILWILSIFKFFKSFVPVS